MCGWLSPAKETTKVEIVWDKLRPVALQVGGLRSLKVCLLWKDTEGRRKGQNPRLPWKEGLSQS